jgi:hypothetical protein
MATDINPEHVKLASLRCSQNNIEFSADQLAAMENQLNIEASIDAEAPEAEAHP